MTVISFGDELLVWGANVLLQVTLVAALALMLSAAFRRSPSARYAVLCSSLMLVLFSPLIAWIMQSTGRSLVSVPFLRGPTANHAAARLQTPLDPQVETSRIAPSNASEVSSSPATAIPAAVNADQPAAVEALTSPASAEGQLPDRLPDAAAFSPPSDVATETVVPRSDPAAARPAATRIGSFVRAVMPPVLLVWFCVSLVLLARLAISWCRLASILRSSKPNTNGLLNDSFQRVRGQLEMTRPPELVLSGRVSGPLAAGLFRPRVVLPERVVDQVSGEQLRNILIHEVAHIVRRDQLVVLLQNVASAVFWIHPLARSLNRRLAQAREEVCDNYVLAATDAPSYSRTLLALAQLVQAARPVPGAVGLYTSRWKLESRVAGLLDQRRSRSVELTRPYKTLVVCLFLAMATVVALGTMTLAVGPSNDTEKEKVADEPTVDANGNIVVRGVVLKPDGTPAVGATVRAAVGVWAPLKRFVGEDYSTPMSDVTTDGQGRFAITISTQPFGDVSQLDRRWHKLWDETRIAASLEGFGPNWIVYKNIDPNEAITLKLVEDHPIRGRVVDLEGRPLQGTKIEIGGPAAAENEDLSKWFAAVRAGEPPWTVYKHANRTVSSRLIGTPEKVVTGDDGSFEIRGFGKDRIVGMTITGEAAAWQSFSAVSRTMKPLQKVITRGSETQSVFGAEFTTSVAPSRPVTGRVVDAKTGQPLPGVTVQSYKLANYPYSAHSVLKAVTDDQGEFRIVGFPKSQGNSLMAVPNDDQPYFMRRTEVPNPAGIDPVSVTVELHRGIWIKGRVIDKVTRKPLAAVRMHYLPFRDNPYAQELPEFDDDGNTHGDQMRYQSKPDGTYRLVGLPGRAVVGAESVLKSYRYGVGYEEISADKEQGTDWLLTYRNPINPSPKWPSSMFEIRPEEDVQEITIDFELDPGASVVLNLVDAQGKPVTGASVTGLAARGYQPAGDAAVQTATNFGPDDERSIIVHHKARNIGQVIRIGEKQVKAGEARVELAACSEVRGRLLDARGEPLTGVEIEPRVLPGGDFSRSLPSVTTDGDGHFRCTLIPGCLYNLFAQGAGLDFYATVADDYEVKPGESVDLGEMILKDRKFVAQKKPAKDDSAGVQPGTKVLQGMVAAPNGQPADGAMVALVADKIAGNVEPKSVVLAESIADAQGRFALRWTDANSKSHVSARLIARTADSGIHWQRADLDAKSATADVKLQPQQLIQARLVDIEGLPAVLLPVELSAISVAKGGKPKESVGFYKFDRLPKAWLPQAITDDHGLLTLTNISAGHGVHLKLNGSDKFAPQSISLNTGQSESRGENDGTYRQLVRNSKAGEVPTLPLAPAQFFSGVVELGETGKPAKNAKISLWASQQETGSMVSIVGKTDDQGRFRLNPYPGIRFGIIAFPPEGSSYQIKRLPNLRWTSGEASQNIRVQLPPGVLIEGTIADATTGKPIHGASIQYHPDQIHNNNLTDDVVTGWQSVKKADAAGRFKIGVPPGPGTLLVHANDRKYVFQQIGSRELDGQTGGARIYAHAFQKIDPKLGESLKPLSIKLRTGGSVVAKLTDPDGNPIERALMVSRLRISPLSPRWRGFADETQSGRFEIQGLAAGETYPVFFLDPKNQLGATAQISTSDPAPTIVLQPCASATARYVDLQGKPVRSGLMFGLGMVVTPGESKYDFQAARKGLTLADEDFVSNIDRENHRNRTTDADGRISYSALIPGARYRITTFGQKPRTFEFVAESGKQFDFGNIEVDIND